MKNKFFKVKTKDKNSRARVGEIKTEKGVVETPCFIPDATYGAVKHLSGEDLKRIGLQMILGNIYHLGIRPGTEVIKKLGGLGEFMNWNGPILTDSGGWQVFSLIYQYGMGEVKKDGIEYKDHLTGKKHWLTPEKCLEDQLDIGSDILMILDYPVAADAEENKNRYSVSTTLRWAKKAFQFWCDKPEFEDKMMMAIIQGANSEKLRKKCYQQLEAVWSWPGYGFGGPTVNNEIIDYTAGLIPEDRLRYLMGAGPPGQIVRSVSMGWDLFDCVVPTRNARHGLAYTFSGEIRIYKAKYELDKSPIEDNCPCWACQNYSRAYIRHLLKIEEPLGKRLMTIHNLTFYMRLMKKIREDIMNGQFRPDKLLSQLENGGC
jgi:queuine tRNA-ribosyltransferase